ncbi:MAG: carboxypeptidase-like regulatory domain-containing protein [Catalinimonas sp.]
MPLRPLFWILLLVVNLCALGVRAQEATPEPPRVIQFSGLVVSGDEQYGVPGVHLYIPKAGRGTTTNAFGYFSMPVAPGDSVIISAVSFKRQYYLVADDTTQDISLIITLKSDTTMLPQVEIFPFPTEEIFKEAFLALELPETQNERMRKNLDENLLARMFYETGMDAGMNHTNFQNQQFDQMHNRSFVPTLQLTNPFAWARFIKSVRRGDLKKKEWQK